MFFSIEKYKKWFLYQYEIDWNIKMFMDLYKSVWSFIE